MKLLRNFKINSNLNHISKAQCLRNLKVNIFTKCPLKLHDKAEWEGQAALPSGAF